LTKNNQSHMIERIIPVLFNNKPKRKGALMASRNVFFAVFFWIATALYGARAAEPDSAYLVELHPGRYLVCKNTFQIIQVPLEKNDATKFYQTGSFIRYDTARAPNDFWGWNYFRVITPTIWKKIDPPKKIPGMIAEIKDSSYAAKPTKDIIPDYRHRAYLFFLGIFFIIVALRRIKSIKQKHFDFALTAVFFSGIIISAFLLAVGRESISISEKWLVAGILSAAVCGCLAAFLIKIWKTRQDKLYYAFYAFYTVIFWWAVALLIFLALCFLLSAELLATAITWAMIAFIIWAGIKINRMREEERWQLRKEMLG